MQDGNEAGRVGRWMIGDWRFEAGTGRLSRGGRETQLPAQPAAILACLARAQGRVVPRDAIRRDVWGDRFLAFDTALHVAIHQLRAALGDDARQPRYIQTVPRTGYRLLVPVAPVRAKRLGRGLIAAATGGIAVLGLVLWSPSGRPGAVQVARPAARSHDEARLAPVLDSIAGVIRRQVARHSGEGAGTLLVALRELGGDTLAVDYRIDRPGARPVRGSMAVAVGRSPDPLAVDQAAALARAAGAEPVVGDAPERRAVRIRSRLP